MNRKRWLTVGGTLLLLTLLMGSSRPILLFVSHDTLESSNPVRLASNNYISQSGTWLPEASDDIGPLFGIAAVSPDDVWAVGQSRSEPTQALALHWDGNAWKDKFAIKSGEAALTFRDVVALGHDDVWAVGAKKGESRSSALIAHWNGNNWSIVPAPFPDEEYNSLEAIDGTAPDNVWAVGGHGSRGAVLHWDGQAWSTIRIELDTKEHISGLAGLDVVSPDDVWVVGGGAILHWNGIRWTQTNNHPKPLSGTVGDLQDIVMISNQDGWAIGHAYWAGGFDHSKAGVLRWDGSIWSATTDNSGDYERVYHSCNSTIFPGNGRGLPSSGVCLFGGLAALTPDNVWAVGGLGGPKAIRWDGQSWSPLTCPIAERTIRLQYGEASKIEPGKWDALWDVAVLSKNVIWGVGTTGTHYGRAGYGYILDLKDRPCQTPMPSPSMPTGPVENALNAAPAR